MNTIVFIKEVLQSLIGGVSKLAGATGFWIQRPKNTSSTDFGWIPDSTGKIPCSANDAPSREIAPRPSAPLSSLPRGSNLWVGLPPRSDIRHARRIKEHISPNMTARDLIKQIAGRLGVSEDKWILIVFSDDKSPYALNEDSKIEKFLVNRSERLYFYPKAMMK